MKRKTLKKCLKMIQIIVYNYNKRSKLFEKYWDFNLKLMLKFKNRNLKLSLFLSKMAWFFRRKLVYYYGS